MKALSALEAEQSPTSALLMTLMASVQVLMLFAQTVQVKGTWPYTIAELMGFVFNRILSRKNLRSLTVSEKEITDSSTWNEYRGLELTGFGTTDDSFSFFIVKPEFICCHPCFYIWTTLLDSLNSNKGWCRVWMESMIKFSIVSKKLLANIMLLHDSAKFSGVKGEEDKAQASKVCFQKMTGLLRHAGFC